MAEEIGLRALKRKIRRYLKHERKSKFKRLASKLYDRGEDELLVSQINKLRGKNKSSYLHRFARIGSCDMVLFLLRFGADPNLQDVYGNTALHLALNYVLVSGDRTFFSDACMPMMLLVSPEVLTSRNRYGETAAALLEENLDMFCKSHRSFLISDDESEELQDRIWKKKLLDEFALDDVELNEDFIQEEHTDMYRHRESFSEWGDRIFQEYTQKHGLGTQGSKSKSKKVPEDSHKIPQRHFVIPESTATSNVQKRLRLLMDREKYESLSILVFNTKDMTALSFADIPWPCSIDRERPENDLECRILELFGYGYNDDEKLTYLKKQQVRWHPDRFMQKCGSRLVESDTEEVLATVTMISKVINKEVSRLQDAKASSSKLCS